MRILRTFSFVFGVNDKPLIVCRNAYLLRPELAYVETEPEHFPPAARSATLRAVVEHVTEIHLFQQVFTGTAASVVGRLQPKEVVAQARNLQSLNYTHIFQSRKHYFWNYYQSISLFRVKQHTH